MDEKEYQELCGACDRVLLAQDSTTERVAIPWLHVIREHPVFLNNYVDLFDSTNGTRAFGRRWLRFLRNGGGWLRQIGRVLRSDGQSWFEAKRLPKQIDVLFVSHLLNENHVGQADDFYFGSLPNKLIEDGYSVVIALVNYTDKDGEKLVSNWRESLVPRVILSKALGVFWELTCLRRAIGESIRLARLAGLEADTLVRNVLARASQEALSSGALSALRIGEQVAALGSELEPRAIVITHEGHAWERVVFASARSVMPKVICVGYQHAALFRLQHAVRRVLAPQYNPDQIVTAGAVSKRQLERVPELAGMPIAVLGTNRSIVGNASGTKVVSHHRSGKTSKELACLVLPEGIESECHLLLEFSFACARVLPQIKFIWRLHPIMNFESLFAKNSKLKKLRKNIVLSNATLEEDIARSHWSLYRGTTAVIATVMAGLRPIYLQLKNELTIDPLYELDVFRIKVASIAEFKQVIYLDVDSPNGLRSEELAIARSYCEGFFLPLEIDALAAIIGRDHER